MNVGWKLFKGKNAPEGVNRPDFNDSSWESVNLPNGVERLPEEASCCANYQGPVWYRKTFTAPEKLKGRRNTLYFEGIMGTVSYTHLDVYKIQGRGCGIKMVCLHGDKLRRLTGATPPCQNGRAGGKPVRATSLPRGIDVYKRQGLA